MPPIATSTPRRDLLVVVIASTLVLAPFLGRPFNIDEPLFVWAARQIAVHPTDPYGFTGNWLGAETPFYRFMQNPPGMSYYLAAAGRVLGWGEVTLHAAVLPVAVLTAVGTYLLAARFCGRPLLATFLFVASPAFLVSATTVMCDVPMVCLWVWAVLLWDRGSAGGRGAWALLTAAGLSAAGAALTKYPGLSLVPLLAAHAALCPARRWPARVAQAVALLVPLAAVVAWNGFSAHRYGVGLVGDAAAYAGRAEQAGLMLARPWRTLNAVAFTGGGGLAVGAVAVAAFVRRGWGRVVIVAVGVVGLGLLAGAVCRTPTGWATRHGPPVWAFYAQYGVQAVAGLAVLIGAAVGVGRAAPDRRRGLFLAVWVAGVFAFAAAINWTVNARTILPLLPAAAILVARAVDRVPLRPLVIATAIAGGVTLWLAVAEARVAAANRSAAFGTAQLATPNRSVWFEGHWGLQFYLERAGGHAVDTGHPAYRPGDLLVMPVDNDWTFAVPDGVTPVRRIEVGGGYWITAISNPMGGGFYASYGDRLPLVIGPIPAESFVVGRVAR